MKNKKKIFRKCLGCYLMKEKNTLIRIVRDKKGDFFLDETSKKDGRGAYVCNNKECIKKLIKNKALERSFKSSIPNFIYESLKSNIINIKEDDTIG